jgi:quinol monooxygenase YgiN
MIIIHAFIHVNPKHRKEFLEQAVQVTIQSQAEEGNISYRLYEETDQPNKFVILEEWKDQTAIEHHEETSHFKKFINDVPDLLLEPLYVAKYVVSTKH